MQLVIKLSVISYAILVTEESKPDDYYIMMDYKEISSKINLRVEQILEHLAFLRYFDENPQYLQENVVKQALRR